MQALHTGVWPMRFHGSATNPAQTAMHDFGTWTAFFDNFTAEIGPDNLFCDCYRVVCLRCLPAVFILSLALMILRASGCQPGKVCMLHVA